MSKRIRNYRSGDRAEDFGIFLLKSFCAVAPIPRQEDFGLADAVATLLRPEGKFWYAEDSFLVQFKSRTEKAMKLRGPAFARWVAQDLSIFIGRVDLNENTIELFTLGTALFDSQLHDAEGLVAWLMGGKEGLHEEMLHLKLERPILKWSVADTEDCGFIDRTYAILKEWVRLERWNRRYFRAGVAREIVWDPNEMPEVGKVVHTWTPDRGREALADIEPLVHLIGLHARQHPELWARVYEIKDALRGPDDHFKSTRMRDFERLADEMFGLSAIVKAHPTADAVVTVQILHLDEEGAKFMLNSYEKQGRGSANCHDGTWEELRQKGFDFEIGRDGPNLKVALDLDRYFLESPSPHEIIEPPETPPNVERGEHSPCIFLRRLPAEESERNTKA